jgi:hypothetical protein
LLIIGTTGTETRFLSESELPDQARQNFNQSMSPKSQLSEDAQLAEAIAKSQDEGKFKKTQYFLVEMFIIKWNDVEKCQIQLLTCIS